MTKLSAALVLAGLVAVPGLAAAEDSPHSVTANVGVYSQYIFRGMTQTDENPALQGGIDYAHGSGFYAGVWGSNVSWLTDSGAYSSGSLELDFYAGLRGPIGKSDFSYDVGVLQYWYPGDVNPGFVEADTTEVYAALGWKWLGAKFSYSLGDTFGFADADGSYYVDLYANYPIADTGLTLGLHYGIQEFDGTGNDNFSYNDWKLSVAYDLGKASDVLKGTTLGVMYTDNDADEAYWGANNPMADSQVTVWISRAF